MTISTGTLEAVIDALEYRLAQVEDAIYATADESARRALRKRRQVYYAEINQATDHA